ncbi:MAG TPA: efflux RND transporter periplasmic adaptor subunit [Edaphobacter sp.]|nr:efflux RND transporter periplasmic adaptor subunit [Edaphobacter sp.]
MASKISKKWIIISVVIVAVGILAYKYWMSKRSGLPAGIVSGNGRIEAKLSDASAKEPLRVQKIMVNEGDLVRPGQVLVQLDTSTLDEELAKNNAAVASAKEEFAAANSGIAEANADIAQANANVAGANADVVSANAAVEQQNGEVQLAQTEADRQTRMLAENATSKALFDVRQTAVLTTKATLKDVEARVEAAQARVGAAQAKTGAAQARRTTAQAQADAARQQIGVALAQVEVTKSRIKDATLISPVTGRVLYRLVEPGEVLGPGGKALTLVDLSDVYMEIFLPSDQAARLKTGEPARITVDYEPNAAAAAYVSFVSPEAQFTPKQVETKSEREKLMFRVKLQIPPEVVTHYIERIKTGVRGVGYVKVNSDARWPDWLEKGLINPTTKTSALEPLHTSVRPN